MTTPHPPETANGEREANPAVGAAAAQQRPPPTHIGYMVWSEDWKTPALYSLGQREAAFDAAKRWKARITKVFAFAVTEQEKDAAQADLRVDPLIAPAVLLFTMSEAGWQSASARYRHDRGWHCRTGGRLAPEGEADGCQYCGRYFPWTWRWYANNICDGCTARMELENPV